MEKKCNVDATNPHADSSVGLVCTRTRRVDAAKRILVAAEVGDVAAQGLASRHLNLNCRSGCSVDTTSRL
eukprot:COSAG06_NODE_4_length_41837_cov_204.557597_7_plen_70_part_00